VEPEWRSYCPSFIHLQLKGLNISVHGSDIWLSWPSVEGETYIVQYRPDLTTNLTWITLAVNLPAATGTNLTVFIHSNQVACHTRQTIGMKFSSDGNGTETLESETKREDKQPAEPMVIPKDGSKAAVPLALYPPGVDLSGYIILWPDGSAEEWNAELVEKWQASQQEETGDPQTKDSGGVPSCGFYRVVKNGVHLWGLTNGTVLRGVVEIPLEMALTNTDQITGISFYTEDGNPLIGASLKNPESPWIMVWDTTMVPNGTYAIYAEVDFAADDSVTNSPVTVTVSNVISFPNYFSRIFGDCMWVYAESTIYPADFEIAMYADETNYIGSFYGYTDDGIISFLWDLTDGGYTFTNHTFKGEFYITPASGKSLPKPGAGGQSSSGSGTNFWAKEYPWSGLGKFVVAYSPLDDNSTRTFRIGLMVAGGTGGEYGGVTYTLGNYGWGLYELSPGNGQGSAFQMYDGMTKTNLLTYLRDISYRNFYYFGHGSPSAIGGAPGTTVPTITAHELQKVLCNFLDSAKPANYHPYRFVFLDGCRTGAGKMCEKFGIPAQTVSTNFFNAAGVRARAFLGFKKKISFNDAQWTWRSLMLSGFFIDWQRGLPLDVCVSNAVNGVHTGGFQKMDSSYVIYGAYNLRIDSP